MKIQVDEIIQILKKINSNGEYDANTMLFNSGFIDSFLLLGKLLPTIEEKYSFTVGAIDLMPENFETPKAICEFIERKKNEK